MGGGHRDTHVEIRDGPSWIDGASNHLEKLIGCDAISHASIEERREWRDDRTGNQGNDVRPNRQRRLALEHADKTYV